jgi:hypothetical protein
MEYFGTAERNGNRCEGDIVKYTAKTNRDQRKIVITPGYRYNPDRYIEVLLYISFYTLLLPLYASF